jgi:cytochrome d ubiquinol oxidase subunit I
MDSALLVHRLHFAFTVTFHYLFPQLTMGLAPLIVILKTLALRRKDETYNPAARFWARIFGINFVIGVVTGIPMEFQFGTNWSHFSRFAGGVIGQTLAMEGMFAFFLESAFLGLFLYGEKRLAPADIGGPPSRSSSDPGPADSLSLPPTHGCSTRLDMQRLPMAPFNCPAFGR